MRSKRYFQKQVTTFTATGACRSLLGETNVLTRPHPFRYLHVQRSIVQRRTAVITHLRMLQRYAPCRAAVRVFQIDNDPRKGILATGRKRTLIRARESAAEIATTKQCLKEVAELLSAAARASTSARWSSRMLLARS